MNTPTRRGSVYMAVLVAVAAVTTLVLTGVTLRKHLHDRAAGSADGSDARRLAVSAAELVAEIAQADQDAFKARAGAGPLFDGFEVPPGKIRAEVVDADTGVAVKPTSRNYAAVAEGVAGGARSRISWRMETPEDDLAILIRSMSSIVAYWPLDEAGSATAAERISGRAGVYPVTTSVGATTHAHGNPAPLFQWYTQFARVPHNAAYELSKGTLAFWVRFDLKPTTDGVNMCAVSKEVSPVNRAMSLTVYLDDDHLCYCLNNDQNWGDTLRAPASKIKEGAWHHVAVTWGSSKIELYLDGVREDEDSGLMYGLHRTVIVLGPPRPANTFDWYFGVRNSPYSIYSQSSPVFGSVARVALFSEQLNATQIRALRDSTSMPPGILVVPGSFATVVD